MTAPVTGPLQITVPPSQALQQGAGNFWSSDAPGFKDILDTINPLEHIPIISGIYRSVTGDTPSTGAKLAGGALFGGPIGFVAALFDAIVESATGSDITGNVMAAIEGKPVPAFQETKETQTAVNMPSGFMSTNKRAAYNAYVNASLLA